MSVKKLSLLQPEEEEHPQDDGSLHLQGKHFVRCFISVFLSFFLFL